MSITSIESAGKKMGKLFKPYNGDLFYQRTETIDGLVYLSRMDPNLDPRKRQAALSKEELLRTETSEQLTAEQQVKTAASLAQREAGDARRRRLAVSLATLSGRPETRVSIVEKGAIAALAKLSHSSDTKARMSCALAFNHLASEVSVRKRMVDDDAHSHIATLALTSNSKTLKRVCLEAICKLATVKGCEGRLVVDGMVSAALAIHRACPSLLGLCLKTLVNLSATKHLVKMDEINDAVIHLSMAVESGSYHEQLLLHALCNLASMKNNQQPLVEDGAIRVVAKAAQSSMASPETVRLCARTLCNFALDARSRPKMADSSTTHAISMLCGVEEVSVKREVAHTIARLAADGTCREKMLQYGIMPVVIALCKDPTADAIVRRSCALALVVFAQDKPFAEVITEQGAVPALLHLSRKNDEATQVHCAHCLCTLVKSGMQLDYLLEQGVMGALIGLARATWQETKAWSALAMYLIFCRPGMLDMPLFSKTAIMAALLGMANEGDTLVRKLCVSAVWTLTKLCPGIEGGSDAIPVLLNLLQREADPELKAECAAALYSLARDPQNCAIMIQSGALLPIIKLAEVGSFHTKVQCLSILQRMLLSPTLPEGVISQSFVSTFLQLSRLEHRDTQQRIVISIFRISREVEGRRFLMAGGAPEHLVRLISKPNEEMRKGCGAILCNLSYDAGQELAITTVGGVRVLLITAMVACDTDACRHLCAKAIMNLLFEQSAHASMVRDGIIWGLTVMSLYKDATVVRLCAIAFCNLSQRFWKEIATAKSMRAVYTLCASDDEETCRASVSTVFNVLMQASNPKNDKALSSKQLERVFCDSVQVLPYAFASKDIHVRLTGLRIAYLISTVDEARILVIENHVLERFDIENVVNVEDVEQLVYAYSCMLTNLALDPHARGAVLAAGVMEAFGQLAGLSDRICSQLAQMMYVSSCGANEVNQNDLVNKYEAPAVVGWMLVSPTMSDSAAVFLSAFLLNLSCCDEAREGLVSEGATKLAKTLWERGNPAIKKEQALVLCNLAMGHINTAKMVRHGAGVVIIDLVNNSTEDHVDVHVRSSAALRNLLRVSGNHTQLAKEGVIPCLVRLATMEAKDPFVRNNCASALRSMTCKKQIRQMLIDNGAVDVILADTSNQDDEDLAIDSRLLCDIEAESWANGIRGVTVEPRSGPVPPLPANESLLERCRTKGPLALLGAQLHTMKWDKIMVPDADLEEPAIASDSVESIPTRFDDLQIGSSMETQLLVKSQPGPELCDVKIELDQNDQGGDETDHNDWLMRSRGDSAVGYLPPITQAILN